MFSAEKKSSLKNFLKKCKNLCTVSRGWGWGVSGTTGGIGDRWTDIDITYTTNRIYTICIAYDC